MDFGLASRVALITGAGGGIGRETALALAAEGVRVAAADLDLAAAQATAAAVADSLDTSAAGTGASIVVRPAALAVALDVTSEPGVRAAVHEVEARLGPVDVLVNCAGIYRVGRFDAVLPAAWAQVLDVNLTGTFLMCRAVLPGMLSRGRGSIVNLASISGRTKATLAAPSYVASKAGVIGLTMSLAAQTAGLGVRVNAVAPGPVDTEMIRALPPDQQATLVTTIPMHRLGTAREIAQAVVFLASEAAGFITGETLNVNGGAFML